MKIMLTLTVVSVSLLSSHASSVVIPLSYDMPNAHGQASAGEVEFDGKPSVLDDGGAGALVQMAKRSVQHKWKSQPSHRK